jgi:hypothetical protein
MFDAQESAVASSQWRLSDKLRGAVFGASFRAMNFAGGAKKWGKW